MKSSSLLAQLDALDKSLSGYIHNLHLPMWVQTYVGFFGWICNKEGPLVLMIVIASVIPHLDESLMRPYYGLYYGLQYYC